MAKSTAFPLATPFTTAWNWPSSASITAPSKVSSCSHFFIPFRSLSSHGSSISLGIDSKGASEGNAAYAVAVNGGYQDDEDEGDTIWYVLM
jgi:hypothetical protein